VYHVKEDGAVAMSANYPSDLTDEQWQLVRPLLPKRKKRGRPPVGGVTMTSFHYNYDNAGNRQAVLRETGTVTTWTYDATYRLTRERVGTGTPTTCAYDAVGNLTLQLTGSRVTYSYDAANQLVRSQSGATLTTYAYDNSGNRRLLQTASRTTYVWDDENRMVTSQPAIPTNYTYDLDNLRVTASYTNTRHVWDGQNAIEERYSGSNVIQVAYTLEPLLRKLLIWLSV